MGIKMQTFPDKESWKTQRTRIGGSDAGVILGLSKWKDNIQLFREKTGQAEAEDISDNPAVRYGIVTEPLIRSLFSGHHPDMKVGYCENNLWTNDKYPFAHASLDGWLEDQDGKRGILEIKTAELSSRARSEEWNDKIPDSYYAQLLHYLMVTGFDFAILCAELKVYRVDGSTEWRIVERRIERPEVQADIDILEGAERMFWKCIETNTEPPRMLPNI